MDKKANHRVDIVRLSAPAVHPNADTLELFTIGGYQVVTKKEQFKEGDLAVYIQPDSVVPQTAPFYFIWQTTRIMSEPTAGEHRCRVTARSARFPSAVAASRSNVSAKSTAKDY